MKLLVVGGGGREHAIIRSLKKNPEITEIFAAPGNGGIAADATCVAIGATDIEKITADKHVINALVANELHKSHKGRTQLAAALLALLGRNVEEGGVKVNIRAVKELQICDFSILAHIGLRFKNRRFYYHLL